jgi:hypothetical protein
MTIAINIAGTNGSGKSHLMYDLFQRTVKTQAVTIRGEIIGYEICLPKVETLVYVVGCYRAATGGADTIKPLSLVFAAIEERLCMGQHVIYEGSFVMNQTKGPELAAELTDRLTVMLLTTPLATCKQSVNERRALRGAGKLPNTEHIESNFKRAHSYAAKMQAAGARLVRVSRAEALPKLMGLLHDA